MSAPWPFAPLAAGSFQAVIIDPPWRWAAGVKSRPQHYPRMTLDEIKALPVRKLLLPEGGRVFLWITAPLIHRVPEISRQSREGWSSWGNQATKFDGVAA